MKVLIGEIPDQHVGHPKRRGFDHALLAKVNFQASGKTEKDRGLIRDITKIFANFECEAGFMGRVIS